MDANYIIKYSANLAEVQAQLRNLNALNAVVAKQFGSEFSKATEIVKRQLDGLSTKTVNINFKDGGSRQVAETFSNISTFARTAEGTVMKFTETFRTVEGYSDSLGTKISILGNQFGQVAQGINTAIAPVGRLNSEFNNVSKVNKDLAKEFGTNFKQIGSVVEKNVNKISQAFATIDGKKVAVPVQQLGAIVKQTDGTFAQLTKTITTLPDGLTRVKTSITQLGTSLKDATKGLKQDMSGLDFTKNIDLVKAQGLKTLTAQLGDGFKVLGQTVAKTDFKTFQEGTEKVSRPVVTLSTNIKDAEGRIGTFKETMVGTKDGLKTVGTSFKEASTLSKTLGENFTRLASRAALTIPTWFLLRNAVMAPFKAMRDGFTALVEFDTVLQKARQNLLATSTDVQGDFDRLKKASIELALETGVSADKIVNSFQKFATVGFNFEDSLAGAINSTKLSVLLFGEATDTADSFARALRVLVDRSKGAKNSQVQIAEAMALTSELWKTNQFDIKEVNAGLEKFATTAKISNISMKETLVLLATLGTAATGGARGGTLLRTSFQKLVENVDKVADVIGVKLNPATDSAFTSINKVVDALEKMDEGNLLAVQRNEALAEVFGGVRGSLPIAGFVSMNRLLKENMAITADVAKFNKEVENISGTLTRQVERWKIVNTEIKKAFVTGLVGGDDFVDSLKTINDTLRDSIGLFKSLGTGINFVFTAGGNTRQLRDNIINFTFQLPDEKEIAKAENDFKKITAGLLSKLNREALEGLILDIELKKIRIPNGINEDQLKQTLQNNLDRIDMDLELKTKIKQQAEVSQKDQNDIAQALLQNELAILRASGARESVILKTEASLKRQLGIEDNVLDKVNRQLQLEQAINKEKRLSNNLSSESVKLFNIAKTEGTQTAKKIGDVLAGNTDFSSFVRRGGKELEIFKKEFADVFEQQQAQQFFSGRSVVGERGLRGGGRIAVQERDTLDARVSTFNPEIARLQEQFNQSTSVIAPPINRNTEAVDRNTTMLEKINAISNLTGTASVPAIANEDTRLKEAILRFEANKIEAFAPQPTAPSNVNVSFNITGDNPEEIAKITLQKWNQEVLNKQSPTGKSFVRALEEY